MSVKMRVVGWKVQPVVMKDDGENLEDAPVQPVFVARVEWEAFKAGGDAGALEQLRQQIEIEEAPPAVV